jgi:integrase
MSVMKLPSGRWRAQVYDPARGRNVSVSQVLEGPGTFATKTEAKHARMRAREQLRQARVEVVTTGAFWERWTSDPLFARPKESTNILNRERTQAFVDRYGHLRLAAIGDEVVAEWLAGGKRNGTVPALRAMFNDAASPKAGRLLTHNPFARLGISRGPGRRHEQPPSEEQIWTLIGHARRLVSPSFAAWLQVAAFSGLRPGELDALRRARVDLARARIEVAEQFDAKTRTFTLPKNGKRREPHLLHQRVPRSSHSPKKASSASCHFEASTGRRAHAPTTGRRCARRLAGAAASTWPPGTLPAGKWSTCSSCPPRMWRSRSAIPTAASSCASSTGTATRSVRWTA